MTPARDDARRAEIAKIHIARAQLGLDDDTYRAMLYGVTARVYSAAELTAAERRAVLDHLRARGFVDKRRSVKWARPDRPGRPVPSEDRARLVGKIRAMLDAYGRPDTYADAIARRMCGVDRYEWATPPQLGKLVAALSYDQRRREKRGE